MFTLESRSAGALHTCKRAEFWNRSPPLFSFFVETINVVVHLFFAHRHTHTHTHTRTHSLSMFYVPCWCWCWCWICSFCGDPRSCNRIKKKNEEKEKKKSHYVYSSLLIEHPMHATNNSISSERKRKKRNLIERTGVEPGKRIKRDFNESEHKNESEGK